MGGGDNEIGFLVRKLMRTLECLLHVRAARLKTDRAFRHILREVHAAILRNQRQFRPFFRRKILLYEFRRQIDRKR